MEILKNINFDWLGHRWKFIGLSSAIALITIVLYFVRGGFVFGVDFTGGTIAYIKFSQTIDFAKVRSALESKIPGTPLIQTYGKRSENTLQVRMEQFAQDEQAIGQQAQLIREALHPAYNTGLETGGKRDLNDTELGAEVITSQLISLDPLNVKAVKTLAEQTTIYQGLAGRIMEVRKERGILADFQDIRRIEGVTESALEKIKTQYYLGNFAIQGVQSIGGIVGKDLRERAQNAIGLSLLGMLVYIAFRFRRWSYGIGAIVSLLHDVVVVLGAFLLFKKEISLTVIASILTIVGYSVNDTIVIFDRVRDNLKLLRRESFINILNLSINQCMGRTILTSAFTFLAVISIFLFGGDVLNGFSFALIVGMVSGTYSTIAIAGPIVLMWHNFFEKRQEGRRA